MDRQLSHIFRIVSITVTQMQQGGATVEIKARLTRKDKDIKDGLNRLKLKDGEVRSDIIREGTRMILKVRGVIETIDDIETAIERK